MCRLMQASCAACAQVGDILGAMKAVVWRPLMGSLGSGSASSLSSLQSGDSPTAMQRALSADMATLDAKLADEPPGHVFGGRRRASVDMPARGSGLSDASAREGRRTSLCLFGTGVELVDDDVVAEQAGAEEQEAAAPAAAPQEAQREGTRSCVTM